VSFGSNGYVIGPVIFGALGRATPRQETVSVDGLGMVRLETRDNILSVQVEGRPELHFDIGPAAREIVDSVSKENQPLRLDATIDDWTGVLLIESFSGRNEEPDFELKTIRFWLVLERG